MCPIDSGVHRRTEKVRKNWTFCAAIRLDARGLKRCFDKISWSDEFRRMDLLYACAADLAKRARSVILIKSTKSPKYSILVRLWRIHLTIFNYSQNARPSGSTFIFPNTHGNSRGTLYGTHSKNRTSPSLAISPDNFEFFPPSGKDANSSKKPRFT